MKRNNGDELLLIVLIIIGLALMFTLVLSCKKETQEPNCQHVVQMLYIYDGDSTKPVSTWKLIGSSVSMDYGIVCGEQLKAFKAMQPERVCTYCRLLKIEIR